MASEILKEQFGRIIDDSTTVVTDITIFDTTKPTDSVTGKPPVRATISQTKQNRRTDKQSRSGTKQQLSSVTEKESARVEATSATDEQTNKEQQPAILSRPLRLCGLLLVLLGAALGWYLYKRFKNKNK